MYELLLNLVGPNLDKDHGGIEIFPNPGVTTCNDGFMVSDPTTATLYFGSGQSAAGPDTQEFWKYTPRDQVITKLANVPMLANVTTHTGAVLLNGVIWALNRNAMASYNIATDKWTTYPDQTDQTMRMYSGSVLLYKGRILRWGNREGRTPSVHGIIEFNPTTKKYSEVSNCPNAITTGGYTRATIVDDKLYALTGRTTKGVRDEFQVYDFLTNKWTVEENRNPMGDRGLMVTHRDKIYHSGPSYTKTLFEYNVVTKQSRKLRSSEYSLTGSLFTVMGDRLFVQGGTESGSTGVKNTKLYSYQLYPSAFPVITDPGHGHKALIAYDAFMDAGYFGLMNKEDFFTAPQVETAAIAPLSGVIPSQVSMDELWMKFWFQGKVLYIPRIYFRGNIAWNTLYTAGLVYGEEGWGMLQPTIAPALQHNVVSKLDDKGQMRQYKVRLPRGAAMNPVPTFPNDPATVPNYWKPSEWTNTIENVTGVNGDYNKHWAELKPIGVGHCIEDAAVNTYGLAAGGNSNPFNRLRSLKTNTAANAYWVPTLELLPLDYVGPPTFPDSGPGSKTIYQGNEQEGYFGRVATALMPSLDEIGQAGGMLLQTGAENAAAKSATDLWLKFSNKGKTLFMPRLPLRTGVKWQELYECGLVYGTDDNGKYPSGAPRNQKAYVPMVEENGRKRWFKVRLISGMEADPGQPFATDVATRVKVSEFYQTMERTLPAVGIDQTWDRTGYPTSPILLQETVFGATGTTDGHHCVANVNTNAGSRGNGNKAVTAGAWYPCLELMPVDFDPLPVIERSGPGPQKLERYLNGAGLFGDLDNTDFFTPEYLEQAGKVPLTAGAIQPGRDIAKLWAKYVVDDKILFIPKRTLRKDLSWEDIYKSGFVYGTNDNGLTIPPVATPTNQLSTVRWIDKAGKTWWFKVRLIQSVTQDPWAEPTNQLTITGSEYWRTVERTIPTVTPTSGGKPVPGGTWRDQIWANYGGIAGSGIAINSATSNDVIYVSVAGNSNAGYRDSRRKWEVNGSAPSLSGWLPVLELLPEDFDPYPTIPDNGPGNKRLREYDFPTKSGYFGRIPATEMPTIDAIEAAGIKSVGGARNPAAATAEWTKFVRNGKVTFFPTVALRTGVDWNSVYNAGLVYGIDGNGKYPVGAGVNQRRTLSFVDTDGKTWTFLVRLASMSTIDPFPSPVNEAQAKASEYGQTIQNIYSGSPLKWDNLFRPEALGIESHTSAPTTHSSMTSTGFNGVAGWPKDGSLGRKGWFPVLELIPNP